jgi:hypothetical protein
MPRRRARRNPTRAQLIVLDARGSREVLLRWDRQLLSLWKPPSGPRLHFNHYVDRKTSGQAGIYYAEASARGVVDARTGAIAWNDDADTARLLDAHGARLDRMLEWLADVSLPPAGVERAEYDVEV